MNEEQFQLYLAEIIGAKNDSVGELNSVQAGIIQILLTKLLELKSELEYKALEEVEKVTDEADKKIASIGEITGGLTSADILDVLTSTSTNKMLSANQGRVLKQLIDNLASVGVTIRDNLTSTAVNEALSANQGRVLKSLIEAITIPQIVNDLVQGGATKTLSAEQGKVLKEMIGAIVVPQIVNDLVTGGTTKTLSAEQGKVLNNNKLDKTGGSIDGSLDITGTLGVSSLKIGSYTITIV